MKYTLCCDDCEIKTFVERKMSDNTPFPTQCPTCGQDTLRRVYDVPTIQFKGEGFHCNDYVSDGPKIENANVKAKIEKAKKGNPHRFKDVGRWKKVNDMYEKRYQERKKNEQKDS